MNKLTRYFIRFHFIILLLLFVRYSYSQIYISDDFSTGISGWTYGESCSSAGIYKGVWDSSAGSPTAGSLELQKTTNTITCDNTPGECPAVCPGFYCYFYKTVVFSPAATQFTLSFNYLLESNFNSSSVTNGEVRIYDNDTHTDLEPWTCLSPCGGVCNSGWLHYSKTYTLCNSIDSITIYLGSYDSWTATPWCRNDWYDSVTLSVTSTTSNIPSVSVNAGATTICAGNSTILNASGATTYTWSPSAGLNATTGTSITAAPDTTTTYTVIGTNSAGCISPPDSIKLTVNPSPTISISTSDTAICRGSSTNLTSTGAINYKWTPANAVSCSTCSNTSTTLESTTTFTVSGANSAGCEDSAMITIHVNPTPFITASPNSDTLCKGQSVTLTDTTNATSYLWSNGSTTSSTNINPITTTTYTIYTVKGMCNDSAMKTIYIYPPILINIPNDSICPGDSAIITAFVSGGKSAYLYNWSDLPGNGPGPYKTSPVSSTYYVCSVTDGCGTSTKDSGAVVIIKPSGVAFTAIPDSISPGEYVTFTNTSKNATSYYWSLGDGNSSLDTSVYHQYNSTGTYIVYLVGYNLKGCANDTVWDTVYVTNGIYVPNVFTPNGDGQNDVFHINTITLKEYSIEIYNRWGQVVFISHSPNIDWTGKNESGIQESAGTYYYIIKATDYNNKQYSLHGFVELLR